MTLDNVQALPAGSRLGDYRLDAVIGHGGFGITYRAFDAQLAKTVAIKEFLPVEFAVRQNGRVVPRASRFADDFAWGRERFLEEARALARFRHPNIVPVLRYFEANGTAYTVMEFEDGPSLAELLRNPGQLLPAAEVLTLRDGLLTGLAAVHAQGFLHRDIKPSNIIIRRDGVPILIDFGAARQAIGGRTLTSVMTPQYAPIEQQALDGKQGPWSDIYSAAAVLHHAVTGAPPPQAPARFGTDPYRPLATIATDRFDPTFLKSIDRALSLSHEQRPQSIDEWSALFGLSPPRLDDLPTRRMSPASTAPPALGGVSRDEHALMPALASIPRRRRRWLIAAVIVLAIFGGSYINDELRGKQAAAPPAVAATQAPAPTPIPAPTSAPTPSVAAPASPPAVPALLENAQRAAKEGRAKLELADQAATEARAMAGEARIVAARAAAPSLQDAQRVPYDDGASYIGQIADGKRQGLGVAEFTSGERQAGEWVADRLQGLGTVRLADDQRYSGQWQAGKSTGLGVREKPGSERAEGNFVDGRQEGPGLRRTLGEPNTVLAGEWRGDALDGPGVETVGSRERYEGEFRGSLRNGYGLLTGADGVAHAGRWKDGKLVDSAP
jgi:predicted Ser/Thr protein kinase